MKSKGFIVRKGDIIKDSKDKSQEKIWEIIVKEANEVLIGDDGALEKISEALFNVDIKLLNDFLSLEFSSQENSNESEEQFKQDDEEINSLKNEVESIQKKLEEIQHQNSNPPEMQQELNSLVPTKTSLIRSKSLPTLFKSMEKEGISRSKSSETDKPQQEEDMGVRYFHACDS